MQGREAATVRGILKNKNHANWVLVSFTWERKEKAACCVHGPLILGQNWAEIWALIWDGKKITKMGLEKKQELDLGS